MIYDSEILTIYKAENGFVVKCRQPPNQKKQATDTPVRDLPDEVNVYANIAQVIKKVKEELAPGDNKEDQVETDESKYKASFKEAAKQK